MKMIIHDLNSEQADKLILEGKDLQVVSDDKTIKSCIGCFGCWIKTPAACVIRDKYKDMGEMISKSSELIIISKCFYGGFSPFVKNVFDRSISYIHPKFTFINNEMHHRQRYNKTFDLRVYFYGDDITDKEKETAVNLVKANAVNLYCNVVEVLFNTDFELYGGKI